MIRMWGRGTLHLLPGDDLVEIRYGFYERIVCPHSGEGGPGGDVKMISMVKTIGPAGTFGRARLEDDAALISTGFCPSGAS